jgi:hypothetical protein
MAAQSRLWCEHGLVVAIEGPEGRRLTTLEKPYARIGSHAKSDIVLAAPGVPRRGLYLHATRAGVFCARLCDDQPTGERGRGWLLPDQAVPLGPYRVSARLAGSRPEAWDRRLEAGDRRPSAVGLDLEARGSAEAPYPVVVVWFAGREVARRRLRRRLTVVGRCRPSALRIWGSDLSAPHLVFYWEAGALWVIDLVSRKGTWLDGAPVEAARLPLGGSLALGEVELTYTGLTGDRRPEAGGEAALLPVERGLAELVAGAPGNCGGLSPCSALAMLFVQLAAEQLAHEREWLDLAAQRQAIEARLGEQLAALERLRADLEGRLRVADARRTDFQSVQQEASRADFQSVAEERETMTDSKSVLPADGKSQGPDGVGHPANGAAPGAQEDFSQAYGELLDRLIALSRERSSWWNRVKDSFSRVFAGGTPEVDAKGEDPKP